MLNKLIILVALPGSGKTYWAKSNIPSDGMFIDDINDIKQLIEASVNYKTILMADPHLCNDRVREIAKSKIMGLFPNLIVEWVYWENAPDKAWKNVCNRNDEREISEAFIKTLAKSYNPPTIDHPVWSKDYVL